MTVTFWESLVAIKNDSLLVGAKGLSQEIKGISGSWESQ